MLVISTHLILSVYVFVILVVLPVSLPPCSVILCLYFPFSDRKGSILITYMCCTYCFFFFFFFFSVFCNSDLFFFPFFLGILYIFLICFFLGLYIVTTFWVTPFSFLYCKHCFTPSLFLLLLLWHFYGLITDLSFFVFFFRDKRLMTFMLELYVLLLFLLTGE